MDLSQTSEPRAPIAATYNPACSCLFFAPPAAFGLRQRNSSSQLIEQEMNPEMLAKNSIFAKEMSGECEYRSRRLPHAKRALYQ